MNYNNTIVGERIKAARCNPFNGVNGYSQGQLAVALGLDSTSRTTIRKWERGEVLPPLDHLLKMCELFGCELGFLLGEYDLPTRAATDIQKETGLSDKAIQAIRHCGEIKLADGYYDITHGIEKNILNLLLESKEFREIVQQLYCCYAALTTMENPDSQRTGRDMIEMEECARDAGLVVLDNQQAAEYFATTAADRLKQFAREKLPRLAGLKEEDVGGNN